MKRESFLRHLTSHPLVYLLLTGACLLAGITLFQLTEPRSDEPRTLLIDGGGAVPDITSHARVEYPGEDSSPEVVQAYVLITGSGDFDYFIAPTAILPELIEQQLIQPIPATGEYSLSINDDYALCLAHSADDRAAAALPDF